MSDRLRVLIDTFPLSYSEWKELRSCFDLHEDELKRLRTPIDGAEVEETATWLDAEAACILYSAQGEPRFAQCATLIRRLSARVAELEAERDRYDTMLKESRKRPELERIDEILTTYGCVMSMTDDECTADRDCSIMAFRDALRALAALTSPPSGGA